MNKPLRMTLIALTLIPLNSCFYFLNQEQKEQLVFEYALNEVRKRHQQDPIVKTNTPFQIALDGIGYFLLFDPKTGDRYYSRNGNFNLNCYGQIIHISGLILDPAITIPMGGLSDYSVDKNGVFYEHDLDPQKKPQELGSLVLTVFKKPEKLRAVENVFHFETVYQETAESGPPIEAMPETFKTRILDRSLERPTPPKIKVNHDIYNYKKVPVSRQLPVAKAHENLEKQSYRFDYQGQVAFVGPAETTTVHLKNAANKTVYTTQSQPDHSFKIDTPLLPGEYTFYSETENQSISWGTFGYSSQTIKVAQDGKVQFKHFPLFHPLKLNLTYPQTHIVSSKRPTFKWQAIPGTDHYSIQISQILPDPNATEYGKSIVKYDIPGNETEYTPKEDLMPNQKYTWMLEAHNAKHDSYAHMNAYFKTACKLWL